MKTLARMFGLIKDQHPRLLLIILLNAGIGLFYLVPPYVLKLVINALVGVAGAPAAASLSQVAGQLGWMAAAFVIMTVLWHIQERISDVVRLDTIIQLRRRLFGHILDLSIDYYETNRAGEIVHKITEGVYEFGTWLQDVSETVLQRVLVIIFSIALITYVNPWAGLVIAATVLIKLWVAVGKKQASKPPRRAARALLAQLNGQYAQQLLAGGNQLAGNVNKLRHRAQVSHHQLDIQCN